jgi:prepilin-type N-terminal cleavage/methylation domain-containing protein
MALSETRVKRISRRLRSEDEGFTIVELMAALSVLAIGFVSLAAALGIGFKQITLGRQRQTATEIGNARVEHLRNVPYASVAMSSAPVHSTDIDDPDYYVSLDGTLYDYSGNDTLEDLVVDTGSGQVLHLEDPVTVGATTMSVFQYVTWADQANAIKRLTVVVVYRPTAIEGTAKMVRVSSLFTPGTVTIAGTSPGASQGSPTPTASPSPSPSGSCGGDTSAPTGNFSILSGTGSQTGYTASTTVTLSLSFTDTCTPISAHFSNDGATYGSTVTYDSLNPSVTWTLTTGDGTKSVWGEVWDNKSPTANKASLGPLTIVLDTTKPTVPGTLSRTLSCSGSDRTAHLTWGSSTDSNLAGYRVYQSVNSAAWTAIGTSSSSSFNDTHKKNLDSVRYYVVAYDKAGNESNATNTIALSKNQCS